MEMLAGRTYLILQMNRILVRFVLEFHIPSAWRAIPNTRVI